MAITVVGTPPQPNMVDNASTTAPLGGTTIVGDLALAYYGVNAAVAAAVTAPLTGYANMESRSSSAQKIYLDYKSAGAGEADPAVTRTSGSATDRFFGGGLILRGANVSSPIHAQVNNASSKASGVITTPALTITLDGTIVIFALVLNCGTTDLTAFGAFNPNGTGAWTQITPTMHSGSAVRSAVVCYYSIQTTAESIAASSIALTGADTGAGSRQVMVAIAPVSSGAAARAMYYHLSGMH